MQGLRCFFIEPANGFFAVDSVYGRSDDAKRFDFFNKVRPLPLVHLLAARCAGDFAMSG